MVVVVVERVVGASAVDTVLGMLVEGVVLANIVLLVVALLHQEVGYNKRRAQVGNLLAGNFDTAVDIVQQDNRHMLLVAKV